MPHPVSRFVRRPAAVLAAACSLALIPARPAWSATDRWEPYPPGVGGPWGGSVYRVVLADPSDTDTAWAATGGGVFRWDPADARWEAAGFRGDLVYDLAVCGGDSPEMILAALGGQGLWASPDEGASWDRVLAGSVKRVAASADCATVWAAGESGGTDLLRRSLDGGATWSDGVPIATVNRIAPSGATAWIAAATGLYRWDEGGNAPVSVPGPDVASASDVSAAGDVVAVASGAELWVSLDGGGAWEERHAASGGAGLDFESVELVAADGNGRVLYWVNGAPAGVLLETNETGFTSVAKPEEGWVPLSLAATADGDWIGAAKAGAYRREFGGAPAWASDGMAAFAAGTLAFAPDGSGRLAAGGGETGEGWGGVLVWNPEDGAWSRAPGLPAPSVAWVGYRGAELWASLPGFGLYRSRDGGGTWEVRNGGLGPSVAQNPGPVLPVPGRPDRLLAGFLETVRASDTAGALWERPAAAPPGAAQRPWQLTLAPPATVYAAAPGQQAGEGLVHRSDDGGGSWVEAARLNAPATAIAAAPRDPDAPVFVGTDGGLWILRNAGGNRFKPGSLPEAAVSALAVDDRPGPARVAVAFQGEGVWIPEDRGNAWQRLPEEGLVAESGRLPFVSALAFEPGTGRLVAGAGTRGLVYLDLGEDAVVTGRITGVAVAGDAATIEFLTDAGEAGWSLDGETFTWDDASGALTVSLPPGDGGLLVFVRFRSAGEESPTYRVLAERPDVTPPSPELSGLTDTVAAGQPVTVTVSGDDVVEYRYRLDGGAFPDAWTLRTVPLELGSPAAGSHILEVEARDEAGNRARVEVRFTVEAQSTEPPGGGTEPPPSSGGGASSGGGGGGGGGCFLTVLGGAE
ncbi:MAG: hypothetical protein Kow0054_06180 [Deferrisoma sp.]